MHSKVITPEIQYYIAHAKVIGHMIVLKADMVNEVWSISYKAGQLITDFEKEIEGLNRVETTEKEFDTAKLKYKEYLIRSK